MSQDEDTNNVNRTLYTRVYPDVMGQFFNAPVTIVGKLQQSGGQNFVETPSGKINLAGALNINLGDGPNIFEIQGVFDQNGILQPHDAVDLKEDFDLDQYETMIKYYHKFNYLTIG
mmetsp:Transcript_3752/g.4073  ORF Transcript_3752/g.4073 Transcript_3752/m.4073 type:complete len:116 (-) Transcript_3752:650-997(-)|eukprot:CAMPEP_0115010612 /NCGR_PEP_ID=MMETSP0216-20121206/23427_1 /TAXON_ID=223996 /ORGANISM="Protocruzia adherens, Strain Boccale" /LENGTH=115 /DNA_ID=CAMNT_0002378875 /DNA_START=69 /DNA_END=416 /DNA_ORIENTATION=-